MPDIFAMPGDKRLDLGTGLNAQLFEQTQGIIIYHA